MLMNNAHIPHQPQKRVSLYDWVRLIATLLVVIGHATYMGMETDSGSLSFPLSASQEIAFSGPVIDFFKQMNPFAYSFHMPLFFMLSGAVLALKELPSLDKIFLSKMRRLVIPYLLTGLLFMLPIKYYCGYYSRENLPQATRLFLAGGNDSGHLWFLLALFWCLLMFCLILKLAERFSIHSSFFILFVCALIEEYSKQYSLCNFPQFYKGMQYIFWFALGYYFETARKAGVFHKLSTRATAALGILLYLFLWKIVKEGFLDTNSRIIIGSFATICIANALDCFMPNIESHPTFKIIMRNLFNVYLFHDPLNFVILKVSFKFGLLDIAYGPLIFVALRTLGVIIVSIVLGELIRKCFYFLSSVTKTLCRA